MTAIAVVMVVLLSFGGAHGLTPGARRSRHRLGLDRRRAVDPFRSVGLVRWLAPRLAAADLPWSTAAVVGRVPAVGAAVAVAGAAVDPVLVLAGPIVVGSGALLALHLARGRRAARLEAELPALLEAIARSLRSGAALPTALAEAATTGSVAADDLASVLAEAERGLGLGEALDRWATRRPTPTIRLVVGALSVASSSGGRPARGVDGVAATLRERAEVDREGRALATQARASAVVVSLAPLAFGVFGAVGDERTAAFLLGSPAGLGCLAAGLVLDAVGAAWMHRIARGPA